MEQEGIGGFKTKKIRKLLGEKVWAGSKERRSESPSERRYGWVNSSTVYTLGLRL